MTHPCKKYVLSTCCVSDTVLSTLDITVSSTDMIYAFREGGLLGGITSHQALVILGVKFSDGSVRAVGIPRSRSFP